MQDMQPPAGRPSIRDIPVPANHRHIPPPPPEQRSPRPPRPRRRSWWRWALAVVVVCAVAGLLLSTVFQGATITLYPKTQNVTGPISITLSPDAGAGSPGYQVITLRASATTTAPASGTQQVSTPASGVITIYNGYSSASQELVATTRFEAPDGKIYRIHAQVTVPGATTQPNGSLTPGSVTATVYADQSGADYNRADPTTFTIPGFQGTARYTAFSAKSQGAISGGFVGSEPAVAPSDLATAQANLKQQLDTAIAAQQAVAVPSGFSPVANSLSTTYDDVSQSGSGTTAQLTESASASEAIVRASDVAAAVATQAVQGYNDEAIAFADPSQVAVALPSAASPTGQLTANVSGQLNLVWQFDSNAIKQALAGQSRSSFEQIIAGFEPAVSSATASIRPFWKATFPSNPNQINLTVSNQS
jgi:hypothetical protein